MRGSGRQADEFLEEMYKRVTDAYGGNWLELTTGISEPIELEKEEVEEIV